MDIDKTLEEVKQTVRREKARDLKPIPSDFYSTASAAAQALETEMLKIGRPRSVEYKMLEDELSGLVTDVETVFMKRVGKVVERATSGAFTNSKSILLKKDIDKLLPAEQVLYEEVLEAIFKSKETLLSDFSDHEDSEKPAYKTGQKGQMPAQKPPEKPPEKSSEKSSEKPSEKLSSDSVPKPDSDSVPKPDSDSISKSGSDSASKSGAGPAVKSDFASDSGSKSGSDSSGSKSGSSKDSSENLINENYVLVRILKDLPEFMGEDKRTYQLKAQDVVELPAANANLLIRRGVASGMTGSSERQS